jgi:thiamine biosynthesis lipoprotein
VERRVGLMGTAVTLEVEAPTRREALAASERALRALEAAEQRLSTWTDDSELARLNRAPVGVPVALSAQLAGELGAARDLWQRTDGAFDPAVGGLVRAWGLRSGGRRPGEDELAAAQVEGGLAALRLEDHTAVRTRPALVLEEGAFGKGAGLDAALRALERGGATRAWLDLGGQVAVLGAGERPYSWGVADPQARETVVLRVPLREGSLATTGNSERGIVVDGERLGHVLDPRSGRPAPDFGSLTVHASDALTADGLSTGLYVLGPEAALAFGRRAADVDVLVLEPTEAGRLRARATGALGEALEVLDERIDLERQPDTSPQTTAVAKAAAAPLSDSLTLQ